MVDTLNLEVAAKKPSEFYGSDGFPSGDCLVQSAPGFLLGDIHGPFFQVELANVLVFKRGSRLVVAEWNPMPFVNGSEQIDAQLDLSLVICIIQSPVHHRRMDGGIENQAGGITQGGGAENRQVQEGSGAHAVMAQGLTEVLILYRQAPLAGRVKHAGQTNGGVNQNASRSLALQLPRKATLQ